MGRTFKMTRPGERYAAIKSASEVAPLHPNVAKAVAGRFQRTGGEMELQSVSFVDKPLHPAWTVERAEQKPGKIRGPRPQLVILDEAQELEAPSPGAIERAFSDGVERELALALPTGPFEMKLWRAFVAGATWEAEYDPYPEYDDDVYYLTDPTGRRMLESFYELLEEMAAPTAETWVEAATMCELGRPLRDHKARCHPACDWKPSR